MKLTLVCHACKTKLGRFDPDKLSIPLKGGMFEPFRPGWPNPFRRDDFTGPDLRCMINRQHGPWPPVQPPDRFRILTAELGWITVGEKIEPPKSQVEQWEEAYQEYSPDFPVLESQEDDDTLAQLLSYLVDHPEATAKELKTALGVKQYDINCRGGLKSLRARASEMCEGVI